VALWRDAMMGLMLPVLMAFATLDGSGEAHAVGVGSDISLCDKQMLKQAGIPWPVSPSLWPTDRAVCGACSRLVYGPER